MGRKLLLDSANLNDIRLIVGTSAVAGVTTNPSLMAKEEKGDYVGHLVEICKILDHPDRIPCEPKHLSVEVITLDPAQMVRQACDLQDALSVFKNVDLHIKIPVSMATLSTISLLSWKYDIKVNATACATATQAKLADDAGAKVVSFFYNRSRDAGVDIDNELITYARLLRTGSTQIICGSIRRISDVRKCWLSDADFVTAKLDIVEDMMYHSVTEDSIRSFQEDIEKWLG